MLQHDSKTTTTPSTAWLTAVSIVLAAFAYFIPTGRIAIDLGFYQFTTGHDIYKMVPLLLIPWVGWRCQAIPAEWPRCPLALPYGLFTLVTLLAAVGSINPYQSLAETLEFCIYAGMFYILLDLPWHAVRVHWIVCAFLAGNLQLVAEATWQWLSHSKEEMIRVSASFDHPNALGAYCVLGTTILMWMYLNSRPLALRAFIGALIAGMQLTAMTTGSRSTLAMMLLLWIALVTVRSSGLRGFSVGMLVLWGLAILSAFTLIDLRMSDTLRTSSLFDDASRLIIWAGMMNTELEALSLFGSGLGPLLQERLQSSMVAYTGPNPPQTQFGTHNWYLTVLLGTGWVGLLVFTWLIASMEQTLRNLPGAAARVLWIGFLVFLVHHFFLDGWMSGNRSIALMVVFLLALRFTPQPQEPTP